MIDTIAAVATAYGEGGIGIIRISGPKTFEILNKVFIPIDNKEIIPRKLTYGHIVDNGNVIDEVMAVYMNGPHTYTAENSAEINCHGSIIALKNTLSFVLKSGARLAEPGEFTKRAFLNGRLDLSQAEAVIDIIKAKTDKGFDVAMKQLDGAYSDNIIAIRNQLVDVLVDITVNIDYPDEDIEIITYDKLSKSLDSIISDIDVLCKSSQSGKIIREGLRVSIIGRPNVGKSSLMNALLKQTRAIVTDIPGTTRDTIEEQINIKGIPVIVTDTAGIRETDDQIERIGIEKSKQAFNDADLIVFIIDASEELSEEDINLMNYIGKRNCIVLKNKSDKGITIDDSLIKGKLINAQIIETSIINNMGIDKIETKIEDMVYGGDIKQNESMVVTNARHAELLRKAREDAQNALTMILEGQPLEFIEVDINSCYGLLGEIIGESVADDIINEVFSRFCLGK